MAGHIKAVAGVKTATIEAVITRADGRIERLGVVSYYHRNPLKRWWWHIKKAAKGVLK